MWTVLVLAIAIAVGVLVYRLTAGGDDVATRTEPAEGGSARGERTGQAREEGEASDAAREPANAPPSGYIPVSGGVTTWHSRLGGAMGLVIAVVVGAIGLALSLWAIVALVGRLVADGG